MTGINTDNETSQPQPVEVPGIIFDLDGTLLDTLADLTSAVNHAIEAIKHEPWPASAIRLMIGDGLWDSRTFTFPRTIWNRDSSTSGATV